MCYALVADTFTAGELARYFPRGLKFYGEPNEEENVQGPSLTGSSALSWFGSVLQQPQTRAFLTETLSTSEPLSRLTQVITTPSIATDAGTSAQSIDSINTPIVSGATMNETYTELKVDHDDHWYEAIYTNQKDAAFFEIQHVNIEGRLQMIVQEGFELKLEHARRDEGWMEDAQVAGSYILDQAKKSAQGDLQPWFEQSPYSGLAPFAHLVQATGIVSTGAGAMITGANEIAENDRLLIRPSEAALPDSERRALIVMRRASIQHHRRLHRGAGREMMRRVISACLRKHEDSMDLAASDFEKLRKSLETARKKFDGGFRYYRRYVDRR